jgi:hypothetical protein
MFAIKLSLVPLGLLVESILVFYQLCYTVYVFIRLCIRIYALRELCHPIFLMSAVETKISSKICAHAMKTHMICHNFWIYPKNRFVNTTHQSYQPLSHGSVFTHNRGFTLESGNASTVYHVRVFFMQYSVLHKYEDRVA